MWKMRIVVGFLTCLTALLAAALFQQRSAAQTGTAAPRCTVWDVVGPGWQMASCPVGTKTCVTVAGRSGGGTTGPISSVQVTCF
jgi:hypothetical protein